MILYGCIDTELIMFLIICRVSIVVDGQRGTCISGSIVFARIFKMVSTCCSHYFIDTSKGSFVSFIVLAAKLSKQPLRNARGAVRKSLRR